MTRRIIPAVRFGLSAYNRRSFNDSTRKWGRSLLLPSLRSVWCGARITYSIQFSRSRSRARLGSIVPDGACCVTARALVYVFSLSLAPSVLYQHGLYQSLAPPGTSAQPAGCLYVPVCEVACVVGAAAAESVRTPSVCTTAASRNERRLPVPRAATSFSVRLSINAHSRVRVAIAPSIRVCRSTCVREYVSRDKVLSLAWNRWRRVANSEESPREERDPM